MALVADAGGRQTAGYDDTGWLFKNVPSVENALNGLNVRPEDYEGGVWYRRTFTLPDSLNGRFVRLNFYAVNYVADVWLNGKYLGYHEGGYTPFSFDVTGAVRFDSANVLAVRVEPPREDLASRRLELVGVQLFARHVVERGQDLAGAVAACGGQAAGEHFVDPIAHGLRGTEAQTVAPPHFH